MTTQLDPAQEKMDQDDGATRLLEYYKSKGISLQLAGQLVNAAASKPAEPDASTTDADMASDLVATIIAKPEMYAVGMQLVAKAYESQRERIADLEDDVERLRPREVFVPEVLLSHEGLCIETKPDGELFLSLRVIGDDFMHTTLPAEQSHQLTTALAKWAGLDGVEWREIASDQKTDGKVLLMDGDFISSGHTSIMGGWNWPGIRPPTHWAPLPKPPVTT